jgi:hypothetical protein
MRFERDEMSKQTLSFSSLYSTKGGGIQRGSLMEETISFIPMECISVSTIMCSFTLSGNLEISAGLILFASKSSSASPTSLRIE